MSDREQQYTVLAHLLRPQGRKGELLAEMLTDFPERFSERKAVLLARPDFKGDASFARTIEVIDYWLPTGKNAGRIVLHFAGIDSITSAEGVAGFDVIVPRGQRVALEEDAEYVDELVGCVVYDGGVLVGEIEEIQFPASSDGTRRLAEAAPILTVRSAEGDEILIPFVKAFVQVVDVAAKRIDMVLPVGLVDLYCNGNAGVGPHADD